MSEIVPRGGRNRLKDDEVSRLFTHGLHEENVFYNRLNFFLVFESVMFAAAMSVVTSKETIAWRLIVVISVMGVVVSLLWWFALWNKLVLLRTLEERAKLACAEFAETVRVADRHKFLRARANTIFAHFFPWLFIAGWVAMFWIVVCSRVT